MIYLFLSAVGNYVSLPGVAETNASEQPTILHVLNSVPIAAAAEATSADSSPQSQSDEHETIDTDDRSTVAPELKPTANTIGDNAQSAAHEQQQETTPTATSDNLVNTLNSDSCKSKNDCSPNIQSTAAEDSPNTISASLLPDTPKPTAPPAIDRRRSAEHVLDIESHLIETYDDYQAKDDGVGINELPPIQHELTQGSSKIATDANVRSVIEVEPAGAKTIRPIETIVQLHRIAEVNETKANIGVQEISDDIKETATKLVNEIEKAALETLSQQILQAKNTKAEPEVEPESVIEPDNLSVSNEFNRQGEKTEPTSTLLEEENNNIALSPKVDTQLSEITEEDINNTTLSQKVDAQLSEITSILKQTKHADVSVNLSGANGEHLNVSIDKPRCNELKIVDVPAPNTPLEAEERKLFIESLPQIETTSDANKLAADCKREYYQSLKKYLVSSSADRPPVPLQTYRWEDLKRAKERGGYPWTHLYKRPLGPDEEPEIVLMLRKSQELRFTSESPKSLKKVRIDEQVLVKEAERYIQELTDYEDEEDAEQHVLATAAHRDDENHSLHSESISCVSDSVLAVGKPRKSKRFTKIRGILKRHRSGRSTEDAQSLPGTSTNTSRRQSEESLATQPQQAPQLADKTSENKSPRCYPIMKKLKSMADRQKKRMNIKRITLKKDEKIVLADETKIMKLKNSPKFPRGEIPHFIEKQDSDDVLEIVELDESPSRKRRDADGRLEEEREAEAEAEETNNAAETTKTSIVEPDEIIEIADIKVQTEKNDNNETKIENDTETETENPEANIIESIEKIETTTTSAPPKKAPRLRREHVYEEIEQNEPAAAEINDIFVANQVENLKQSLAKQDVGAQQEIEAASKQIPLDRMGSSTESTDSKPFNLLAPISSVDSTSSDEDRGRPQLSPVAEETEAASIDGQLTERETTAILQIVEENEQTELKPSIKKESSPAPSDKKVVTFSHVEDEAEPHREDIELPDDVREAVEAAVSNKWKNLSDHEYEPIGVPPADDTTENEHHSLVKESSPKLSIQTNQNDSVDIEQISDEMKDAEEMQKDLEERYFSSATTTPRSESRTDYEIHTSQVDSSALEELPLKPENRKKGFIASAQDRTRKMQAGIKNQAGKIKTKLRTPTKKPTPSASPKAKDRKRFKAPEFSKLKMPEIKRPEFTKFNKPDMSKFKLPEKFSTLKLKRSKSLKETETVHPDDDMSGITPPESGVGVAAETTQPQKKLFEFNFGTYPRAFRTKKKTPVEPQSSLGTEDPSIIPSTETQPSVESSSSPQGDRGPGPVRSRWADKFSDVSYNDSEGSRYRRYGSEQESFDRESSLERRMKGDLEDETASETPELGILGGVADNKQFAEFDEENRAIHEISNLRAGEFKRRPITHQDSDLRSEDSKEAVGWTDMEIQKNKLLRKAELEAEASYLKYPSDERITQETQSTASSGKKVVMEEIDDDEFFLRKRGISEDNIELRQYISNVIREGYETPMNALEHVGHTSQPMEYGDYDIPPPKPRRLHKTYRPEEDSQEFDMQRSEYGDDLSMSHNGSDYFGAPKRPLRKGRSRSKYSMDSQDIPMADQSISNAPYFDDDEEYLRPPRNLYKDTQEHDDLRLNNLDVARKDYFTNEEENENAIRPQAPTRRKRHLRDSSMDKDSYINGFSGRSISNSYLQPSEDVIVYRTEHEYHIPLATPEQYTNGEGSTPTRKSRSISRYEEDDQTSRGVDSLGLDAVNLKGHYDLDAMQQEVEDDNQEKFVIDMIESDGYAVVRKEQVPKPTPPARRKKFTRSPGERFVTSPNVRETTLNTPPPPERPPPPRSYTPSAVQPDEELSQRKSASLHLDANQNYVDDGDYEEAGERPESPRNLQSGEIINKMKYRPLPAPPRPPREKRLRGDRASREDSRDDHRFEEHDGGIASSSTADSYDQNADFDDERLFAEIERSTQTDPLPEDFVCEEFEITDDMKIIEPRRPAKTLEEMLKEEAEAAKQEQEAAAEFARQLTEDEQLARGLQRFREANQRSLSEKSRASSSQADRSKSLSRPQTPSAVVIERRVSTPVPSQHNETMLEASLIVRPIDDLDLEEEALRREGLLTDSSQQSKSDVESYDRRAGDDDIDSKIVLSDAPSSIEIDVTSLGLRSQEESELDTEKEEELEDKEEEREELEEIEEELEEREEVREELEDVDKLKKVSELDDDEIIRTLRDYGYDTDLAAKFLAQHDDDDNADAEVESVLSDEKQELGKWHRQELRASKEATPEERAIDEVSEDANEDVSEDPVKYDYERKKSADREQLIEKDIEETEQEIPYEPQQQPPQPPPRRKSTTTIETSPSLAVVEQQPREVTPISSALPQPVLEQPSPQTNLPTRFGDLEVERLRVHALQAGQIMVSQLHGTQISSDELDCKSGSLVVKNIELPPGFIEDLVERVRSTDRNQLLSAETQTSLQASSEILPTEQQCTTTLREPPPKPPRQKDLEATAGVTQPPTSLLQSTAVTPVEVHQQRADLVLHELRNLDEQTQTDSHFSSAIPPVYATTEYLQSLPPLAFYNRRVGDDEHGVVNDEGSRYRRHHHHHRHHYHRCDSSSSTEAGEQQLDQDETRERRHRSCSSRRSRSSTRPPTEREEQSVGQAARQFISACSISLVDIINQLTSCIRGGANADKDAATQIRKVPTLVVLFIVITFGLLLFLLSGKSVHTHHWDYFNPPGHEGRKS